MSDEELKAAFTVFTMIIMMGMIIGMCI